MYSILLLFLGVKELNGGEEMTDDENVSTDGEDLNDSGNKRITNNFPKTLVSWIHSTAKFAEI